MTAARSHGEYYDVAILGAGYAGLVAALRFSPWSCPLKAVLISERIGFTERVRLQEALVAPVAPRLPPLDTWLGETKLDFLEGLVTSLDPTGGTVTVETSNRSIFVAFDRCIYALGSITDVRNVAGVSEHAYRLDLGEGPRSGQALRNRLRELTAQSEIIVVGGGNTAVEAAAEIKAARPELRVTIAAAAWAGDFNKGARVEKAVRSELIAQGVLIMDNQLIRYVGADHLVTESGRRIPATLCIWAGGQQSPDIARDAGVFVDEVNRIWVDPALRSISHPQIIAVGDAARPIAPTGAAYRPSALAALTSGAYAARSLLKEASGRSTRPFSFSAFGQGVAIGTAGVGFLTYPDDGEGHLVVRGSFALRLRNLFVRTLIWFLRLERFWPGLTLFWVGRKRVRSSDSSVPGDKLRDKSARSENEQPIRARRGTGSGDTAKRAATKE